jgi:hypothetical protein
MIVFYSILFIVVFFLFFARKGIRYIIFLDLFFQIFTGSLNGTFDVFLKPADWSILIIFINFIIYSFLKKRSYFLRFTFIDKIVLFYFIIVLLIPLMVNYYNYGSSITFKYFIPIRFWLVYRNYYCFFEENKYKSTDKISVDFIFKYLLLLGIVSAVLSISRFFNYPGRSIIEDLWPIYYQDKQIPMTEWGRLCGTMSGTNGTGNYFCFLTAISLLKLEIKKKITWIFPFFFSLAVILSGSFSSIAALFVILFINFKNKLFSFRFVLILGIVLLGAVVLTKTDVFRQKLERRVETGYKGEKAVGILPSNLVARYGYWSTFLNILIRDNRIYFGMGPGGFFNYQYGKDDVINQNAESFYFRILNESGIFALFYIIVFFSIIYWQIQTFSKDPRIVKYQLLFKQIIIILLVAGIANETLYYGSNTSLFGTFLGILGYLMLNRNSIPIDKR